MPRPYATHIVSRFELSLPFKEMGSASRNHETRVALFDGGAALPFPCLGAARVARHRRDLAIHRPKLGAVGFSPPLARGAVAAVTYSSPHDGDAIHTTMLTRHADISPRSQVGLPLLVVQM